MGKRKAGPVIAGIVLVAVIGIIIVATKLIQKYIPSDERQDLTEYYGLTNSSESMAIVLNDQVSDVKARYLDGTVYVDYDTVHDLFNERFYWDANENLLLYTLPDSLLTIPSGGNTYQQDKETKTTDYTIVRNDKDTMYMALDFVKQYTNLTYTVYEDPNRVVINTEWGDVETVTVKRDSELRVKGGIKSPILCDVQKGQVLDVLETGEKWTKVCTLDGYVGYVKNNYLGSRDTITRSNEFTEPVFTHITKDFTIEMAWHQVTTKDANSNVANVLQSTKGINVISPTWFYLKNSNGDIGSYASSDYVSYCHQQGIEVWGLVSNLTDNTTVEDTTYVMTHTSARQNLENQLISEAISYNLDGINLDFESLSGSVGDGYIQFIRELSLKCANNGIVLSVDNYVPSEYTAFYNRAEQANFADYIVVMAYDEHYGGGNEAGSVASIGWVTDGVVNTLQEVPAEQIILGCPFYTKLWSLTPVEPEVTEEDTEAETETDEATTEESDGETEDGTVYTIGYENLGMDTSKRRLEMNGATYSWSDEYGQNYGEFEKDGVIYQIWLEDADSIALKLDVMKNYQLAGCSFWKLGFESPSIWDTIIKYTD
ncbi:MAG: glycosyl hydrolase family 18 protein [Roseburia sp.]